MMEVSGHHLTTSSLLFPQSYQLMSTLLEMINAIYKCPAPHCTHHHEKIAGFPWTSLQGCLCVTLSFWMDVCAKKLLMFPSSH